MPILGSSIWKGDRTARGLPWRPTIPRNSLGGEACSPTISRHSLPRSTRIRTHWISNKDNDELRGVLNAGHRKGGAVLRTVGDSHEARKFSCWAPERDRFRPVVRHDHLPLHFLSQFREQLSSAHRIRPGVELGQFKTPTLSGPFGILRSVVPNQPIEDPNSHAQASGGLLAFLLVFDQRQAGEALHVCVCVNDTVCLNHDGVQLHFVACAVDGSLRERREQDRSISSFRWCSPRWRSAISSRRFMTVSRKGSPTGARGHVAARGGQTRSPQLMLSYSRF